MWFTPEVRDLFLSLTLEIRSLSDVLHGLGKPFNVGTTLPSIPMFDHKNVAKSSWITQTTMMTVLMH